jgi:DNA-binding PucR family transcriptional regulator
MEQLAATVARALGGTNALTLPSGRLFFGWASVKSDPPLEELRRTSDGLRVAVGRPARGVEGFRRSHREALLARRVVTLSRRPRGECVSFGSVALDALLTEDLDEARRFVENELGDLVGDDSDACRRLAATLEVFLDEKSSFVRTARRLGVHANTVAYRVARAEELLGHDTSERQLELRTALRLTHVVQAAASRQT